VIKSAGVETRPRLSYFQKNRFRGKKKSVGTFLEQRRTLCLSRGKIIYKNFRKKIGFAGKGGKGISARGVLKT